MLSALNRNGHTTILDFFVPLIKYCICKTYLVGNTVDIEVIKKVFVDEYGYQDIISNVLKKLFEKLVKQDVLTKENGRYVLSKDLTDEYERIKRITKEFNDKNEKIYQSFLRFLTNKRYSFILSNIEQFNKGLIVFLCEFGYKTAYSVSYLSKVVLEKNNQFQHLFARFLIEEYGKQSEIFNSFIEIINGFYIATVICNFSNEAIDLGKKYRNLYCYLDTPIIMGILDMQKQEYNKCCKEMFKLFVDNGIHICCFKHNIDELRGIIHAYKNSLYNYNKYTISLFDRLRYNDNQINIFESQLENKLENLGVEIEKQIYYDERYNNFKRKNNNIIEDLKNEIEKIHANSGPEATEYDCNSGQSIWYLYETCSNKKVYVFVTRNVPLCGIINKSISKINSYGFHYCMTDIDLSSLIWCGSLKLNNDCAKYKIIADAYSLIKIPNAIIDNCRKEIERYIENGEMTPDSLLAMRHSGFDIIEKTYEKMDNDCTENIDSALLKAYIEFKNNSTADYKREIIDKFNIEEKNKIKEIIDSYDNKCSKWSKIIKYTVVVLIILFTLGIIFLLFFEEIKNVISNQTPRFNILKLIILIIVNFMSILSLFKYKYLADRIYKLIYGILDNKKNIEINKIISKYDEIREKI